MSKKVLIISCLMAVILVSNCIAKVNYTREVNSKIPAGQAKNFTAETHNGKITVTGCQTTDCSLISTITVKAKDKETAKNIAEQVQVVRSKQRPITVMLQSLMQQVERICQLITAV